jgi:hypothetical protein
MKACKRSGDFERAACIPRLAVVICTISLLLSVYDEPVHAATANLAATFDNEYNGDNYIGLMIDHYPDGLWDTPLIVSESLAITGKETNGPGLTIYVEITVAGSGNESSKLDDGYTCDLVVTAECAYELGVSVTNYNTKSCAGADENTACTSWARQTAKGITIAGKTSSYVTGLCGGTCCWLKRTLRTNFYFNGKHQWENAHTVGNRAAFFTKYVVKC